MGFKIISCSEAELQNFSFQNRFPRQVKEIYIQIFMKPAPRFDGGLGAQGRTTLRVRH